MLKNNQKFSKISYFVIRCNTEYHKGFGNLNRCLILARVLKKNFQILFLIDKNLKAKKLILENGFTCKEFSKDIDEIKYIKNLYKKVSFSSLLLDVREKGEYLAKHLKNDNYKIIQIDDAWCKNIFSDVYFNGLPHKTKKSFIKKNSNAKIFVGSNFWISHHDIFEHKKPINSIVKKNHYTVTISLGGADPKNLTSLILKSISSLQNIDIFVVIGPFFYNIDFLKNFKNKKNVRIIKNNYSLWKIFQKSDIVICSTGNTVFDLLAQQVPTISIPIVRHQYSYSQFLDSKHLSVTLSPASKLSQNRVKQSLKSFLQNTQKRKKMAKSGQIFFDGKGTSRVITNILQSIRLTN